MTALAQIAADELDIDLSRVQMIRASTASQPQRGRHLGQPLHPAVGTRAAPCLRRGSPDLSSTGGGTAGGRCRCARHRGRHHFGPRQCHDQLLGTCRRSLARSRRHARRNAKDRIAAGAGREFGAADRHSGQGFGPAAIHPRSGPGGNAAWPRAAAGERARETYRIEGGWRPRNAPVSSRSCATAVLPASSARPSMARRRLSTPCARARPGPTASPCPTKTIWLHS